MWDYASASIMQVTGHVQKRPIDVKEKDVNLALHFHLSEGGTEQHLAR